MVNELNHFGKKKNSQRVKQHQDINLIDAYNISIDKSLKRALRMSR